MKRPGGRTRNGKKIDPKSLHDLTQPIAAIKSDISEPLEKLRRYHAELTDILAKYNSELGPFEKFSMHVRRHLPLYALAAVFALIVILVPTRNNNAGNASSITAAGNPNAGATDTQAAGGPSTSGLGNAVTTNGGGTSASGAGGSAVVGSVGSGGGSVPTVAVGTGIARGGFACKPGVREIPFSTYAAPCVAKFTGSNGGATYRGVTDTTINIVVRKTADSGGPSAATVDQANKAAGMATRTEFLQFVKQYWLPYFNKTMELYGRKVTLSEYGSTQSNGVDEAQSKNKDGACADATAIANTVKAFGDVGFSTGFQESQPFSECAKEKGGIWVPLGAPYFPEGATHLPSDASLAQVSYIGWDPYVWDTVTNCEQIAHDVAEYIGKRLIDRNAIWARNALYQQTKRAFGTYVPDNAGYQHCVNISETDLKQKYHTTPVWRHNYPLDVTRFPDQAATASIEFQQHGVTTLINACDTISSRLLTEAADKNGWGPEWFIIGVAGQDTNGSARTFNKNAVAGHLFGMSQLGPDRLTLGKDSEPYRAFKAANPGVEPPQGALQAYWPLMHMFNLLQAAGPILTPRNIALGAQKLPPGGGSKGAVGTWYLGRNHTEIVDSREIFWDSTIPTSQSGDGGAGAYIESNGGRRYGSGQWPATTPAIHPK